MAIVFSPPRLREIQEILFNASVIKSNELERGHPARKGRQAVLVRRENVSNGCLATSAARDSEDVSKVRMGSLERCFAPLEVSKADRQIGVTVNS